MDTSEGRNPLYRYKTVVWIARTYEVMAEDESQMEDRVQDAMLQDGLSPEEFSLVRMQASRTQIHWQ